MTVSVRAGLAAVLLTVSLVGSILQGGVGSSVVSYQRSQHIMDIPSFYERMHQESPELARIIWKHGLFIEDGTVDDDETAIALSITRQFPRPVEYVVQKQQKKTTTLSGNGLTKTFQNKLETDYFTLHYNNQTTAEISEALVILQIGLEKASTFFKRPPNTRFGIFLFDSKEDKDRYFKFEVDPPNNYVWYSYDLENRARVKNLLIHELTHLIAVDYLGQHWKWAWLEEGFCEYLGWEHFWKYGFESLKYYLNEGQILQSLNQMVTAEDWEHHRETGQWIVYPQAYALVEFLVETFGDSEVLELFSLSKIPGASSPDGALRKSIGLSVAELEAEFLDWFAKGSVDSDNDGLNDAREQHYGASVTLWDTDDDGLSDGLEVQLGTDPTNPDTDGDGLRDGAEVSIAVDGFLRDWERLGIKPSVQDSESDSKGRIVGSDLQSMYAAFDDKYLYLAFKLYDNINTENKVQYLFGIDMNGDGTWEYQPGFDLSGNAWLWNLTQGMDYSNLTKFSPQYGTIAAASDVVEFRMPLFATGCPKSMWVESYLVVQQGGKYMQADVADRFRIDVVHNKLPPSTNPLVPDSTAITINGTTSTGTVTTTSGTFTTTAATTLEGTRVPETGTSTITSMQLLAGVSTIQTLAIAGIVLVIIAAVGAFFLQRRRK